ncbi:MAG: cation:proton antiporter, partial [Planctomycetales bacterium]|nr:cation:proton antiporter [Planctomycetales bacterium]
SLGLTWLLNRVFNEPTVEITLTIVMAYGAMILAEAFLHVSGVIAIVTMGLWMSGPGRTAISPEVRGRQHHFFGMLAYIANTLIFFLAGVVIVAEFEHFRPVGILIVVLAWLGIMAIRFGITFLFQPMMNRLGPKVSLRQATVISWGGLRGAVSLALALVVAGNTDIEPETRSQILRATAGVVMLTILVNGTTTGWLLRKLGFSKRPIGERLMRLQAQSRLLERVEGDIERLAHRTRYRTIHWNDIRQSMAERRRTLNDHIRQTRAEVSSDSPQDLLQLAWYQAIAIERTAYLESNETGMISGTTLQILEFEVDSQLERIAVGEMRAPVSRSGRALKLRNFFLRVARRSPFGTNKLAFRDLSRLYELAWVESLAAGRVLGELEQASDRESEAVRTVSTAYHAFRKNARERLEDLRSNAPEVAGAIERRLGRRVELNIERTTLERLEKEGVITDEVGNDFLKIIEERMAKLASSPVRSDLPSAAELLRALPLFRALEDEMINQLARAAKEIVFGKDETLLKEGETDDAMYLIARGAAHVIKGSGETEQVLDILGGGEIVGEMALLTGEPLPPIEPLRSSRCQRPPINLSCHSQESFGPRPWTRSRKRRSKSPDKSLRSASSSSPARRSKWMTPRKWSVWKRRSLNSRRTSPSGVRRRRGLSITDLGRVVANFRRGRRGARSGASPSLINARFVAPVAVPIAGDRRLAGPA